MFEGSPAGNRDYRMANQLIEFEHRKLAQRSENKARYGNRKHHQQHDYGIGHPIAIQGCNGAPGNTADSGDGQRHQAQYG